MTHAARARQWAGLVGLLWLGLVGCTGGRNTVTGRITPEHFDFTPVVTKPGRVDEAGGWWVVCIHARIVEGDSEARSICKFEVGLPQRNAFQGNISLEAAQEAAAEMANRAAYKVLSEAQPGTMLAMHCLHFKKLYRLMLDEKVQGARVGECVTRSVKTVHFNVPYHCD